MNKICILVKSSAHHKGQFYEAKGPEFGVFCLLLGAVWMLKPVIAGPDSAALDGPGDEEEQAGLEQHSHQGHNLKKNGDCYNLKSILKEFGIP
jgi:hypothetical protein